MKERFAITADDPAFAGHFPGDPALPGIAQLALAARTAGAAPRGVRRVKYREPVRPGAELAVELESAGGEGTLRFLIRDGSTPVSEGLLDVGPAAAGEPAPFAIPPRGTAIPRSAILEMLPHRGPALYVTDVLGVPAAGDEPCWFAGRVPAESFLARDGRVSTLATIEYACQTGAMTPELRAPEGHPVRALRGLLAGVKQAGFAAPDFALDAELVAAVRTTSRASFVNVHAEIGTLQGGIARALATVELTILVV